MGNAAFHLMCYTMFNCSVSYFVQVYFALSVTKFDLLKTYNGVVLFGEEKLQFMGFLLELDLSLLTLQFM